MIITILPPVFISREIDALLPRHFISRLCAKEAPIVKEVVGNHFLFFCDKTWAQWRPESKRIFLDPSVTRELIVSTLRVRFPGIQESQAWPITFLHELAHAKNGVWTEAECDSFARERLRRGVC